jgi:tetratricopeptide (TPR) repeat protein
MFFGREDVFNWIERSLTGKFVNNILVLHGQRRVGKTSILKQIPNFLTDKYIQVFFDLQGRTGTTLDRFLWWVASEIVRTLKTEHNFAFPKPDRKLFEDTEVLIGEFLPSLRPILGEKVLLLTFDEFDILDRPEIQEVLAQPLITYLRRLIELDYLNFIFSIGSSGDKLENMRASYTDFFKIALYRKISFLTRDDSYRLITNPVEGLIKYEKKAVDHIFRISSGHPYFTQLICHELFSRCQKTGAREISANDVEDVLGDVIERGTVNLKFVWDESSDLEKWVLAALAQMNGGNTNKLMEVLESQRVRFSDSDLNSAIIHLRDKDVLTQDNHFVIRLMQMWLVANRPMDRVREELVDVNPIANRYIEIGDEYRDREQYQAAIESYQQALNVDARNLKAQTRIGAVYLKQENYSNAIIAFESALRIDDEDVLARTGYCEANLALGEAAQKGGETENAIGFYQAILDINPVHIDARQQMASIFQERAEEYLAVGKDNEALDNFKKALMFVPEDDRLSARYEEILEENKSKVIQTWLEKSEKALSRQHWDEAVEMVEEAIKIDPEDHDLRVKLREVKDAPRQFKLDEYHREAEQAISHGNWERAIAAIETAVQLAPEDPSLVSWLDAIHEDQLKAQMDLYAQQIEKSIATENWDDAIQACQKAIKLAPEDERWRGRLAEINHIRHQVKMDSLHTQANEARKKNEWDKVIHLLKDLLELEESEDLRSEIEQARKDKREYELAAFRSQAEKATEDENWGEAAKAWASYLALTPEDADRVVSKLDHARKFAQISDAYDEAEEAIRKKHYAKAIKLLQGIISQDPTYKSTSRLLVEAVEANKSIPVWRQPWLYGAFGALAVLFLGIFFAPRLLETLSSEPQTTPANKEFVNVTSESIEPTSITTPFAEEETQASDVLDGVAIGTKEAPEPSPPPIADPRILNLRILNPENNHQYLYSRDSGSGSHSWEFARDDCASMGGYLVTIQDAAENEFVRQLAVFLDQSWLGATDEEEEGAWVWVTGEPWQYTNWNPGEPNDSNGGEDYLIFDHGLGWSALDATEQDTSGKTPRFYYVCEWDPEPNWLVEKGDQYSPIFEYIGSKSPTFEDDFSTAKSEWGLTNGGTSITDMRKNETLFVMNPGSDVILPSNGLFNATNFVLAFDFLPPESSGVLGVTFRASHNLETYYKFKFSFSNSVIRDGWLFSRNDGSNIRTTDQGFVTLLEGYNQILVIVRERNLAIFVNDEQIFDCTDLAFWGDENFIIFAKNEERIGVSLDNIKFWNLEGVEFE